MLSTRYISIHWIVFYPLDSGIQRFSNPGQLYCIGQLTKFKADTSEERKILIHKVVKFYRRLYPGGTTLSPSEQTSVRFCDFEKLYLC